MNQLTKKIDVLFQILGCTNSDIARLAECSPSEISRLHSGARRHRPASRPVVRFAEAVCAYALRAHCGDDLARLCRADGEALPSALISWLYDETALPPEHFVPAERRGLQKEKRQPFGGKLGSVMDLLELSNVRLAQKINVDASTISRFRSGLRMPAHPISELLSAALLERARQAERARELSELCKIPKERLFSGGSEFSDWLYCRAEAPTFSEINGLLDGIYRAMEHDAEPLYPLSEEGINREKAIYWGIDGLREAAIRFLSEAAKDGGELWLYSDQDTAWMFRDKSFTEKWAALMSACLRAGVKMRIIHNIDRTTGEMISAIQNWLPLYMSGRIESYACPAETHARFSHTIFLRPKAECVTGFCVCGGEAEGWYDYITEPRRLDALAAEYDKLLKKSAPLAKVVLDGGAPRTAPKTLLRLAPLPPLAVLPPHWLRALAIRNGLSEAEGDALSDYLESQSYAEEQTVCELFALPAQEELEGGRLRLALPAALCRKALYYTRAEWEEHLCALLADMDEHPRHRIVVLPELPFAKLKITVTEAKVSVMHTDKPFAAFEFPDPRMIRAFQEYIKILQNRFGGDGALSRRLIEEYLDKLRKMR